MKREFYKELVKWNKFNPYIPFMLIGARQTGKTYLINEFCKNNFNNYIYINLEKNKEIREIFEDSLDPAEIIKKISIIINTSIAPDNEDTIIFFDEIQVSEKAITSLKYFCESEKKYRIICAGSLLGVVLNRFKSSFPVGKIIIKHFYPMTFKEFLLACNQELLIDEIKGCYKKMRAISNPIHNKAINLYKEYLILGGMPMIVKNYVDNNFDITKVDFEFQKYIIDSYKSDMNKYTENTESIKINKIYNSMPSQLLKENKKFMYNLIEEKGRKLQFESSIDWLVASGLVIKSTLVTKNESPIKAFLDNDKFKLYLSDAGLLCKLSDITPESILLDKIDSYKGALAENYVASELSTILNELYYYTFYKYEIEFLINIKGDIIPVEVKSGVNINSKSLNNYIEKYKPIYSIRLSLKNFGFENNIKSIPLYALFCLTEEIKGE